MYMPVVVIGVHTLTRESQEVMPMSTSGPSDVKGPEDAEDIRSLKARTDIPCGGQLNSTISSLPDSPAYPGVSTKLKLMNGLSEACNVSS